MIDTKALRNKILDAAIRGKLTEQLPEDGNAEDLYQQIQAEKQKLVKEGKLKKEKPLPEITDDEMPFDIPDNWKLVRLIDCCEKITDYVASGSFASLRENVRYYKTEEYALLVKTADFGNGFSRDLTFTDKHGYEFLSNSNLFGGELIVSNIGASIGKVFIVPNLVKPMTLAPNSIMIRIPQNASILKEYLFFLFKSSYGQDCFAKISGGTATPKMNKSDLKTICIPLPPLAEQRRIVEKIESLFSQLDLIDKLQNQLSDNASVLRNKLIELGIEGKLTEQLPEDGDAEDLYKEIQSEKQRLIKEGKIKKEKNESYIFRRYNSHYEKLRDFERCIDDEIPFEIPVNWKWVRLGDVTTYNQLKSKVSKDKISADTWSLDLEDIEKDTGKIVALVTASNRKISGEKIIFREGQILYSKLRPYLRKILIASADGICSSEIVPFDCYCIDARYLVIVLKSPYVDAIVNEASYGVKMPRVGTETMTNLLLPIPPLQEQQRIVTKLDSLLSLVDNL